jgi:hypothetical protein
MCMKKKIVDFLLVSVFRSKIYFAKYEQVKIGGRFFGISAVLKKTEIMRNSVLNHFAKQKKGIGISLCIIAKQKDAKFCFDLIENRQNLL